MSAYVISDITVNNPERYEYRADCYVEMEDYTNALVDLSKAINLAPDEAKWYAYRSDIYGYIKDKEKQLNDINTALDLDKVRYIYNRCVQKNLNQTVLS